MENHRPMILHARNESSSAGELSCVLYSAAEPSFAGEAAMKSGNDSGRAGELSFLIW